MTKHFSENQLPYIPARLSDRKGDLSKTWLIEYQCWSSITGNLCRRQKRIPSKLETAEARRTYANKVIAQINHLLANGYHVAHKPKPNKGASSANLSIAQGFEHAYRIIEKRISTQSIPNFLSLKNRFIERITETHRAAKPISTLTRVDIEDFLDTMQTTRSISNLTRNNYLSYIQSFTKYFLANNLITSDPTSGIDRLKFREPEISSYSDAEKTQIIGYLKEHDYQLYLYIRFIYYTFRRCTETRLIQLKHLNFDKRSIYFPPSNVKGGRAQTIYFSAALRDQLLQFGWNKLDPDWYLFGNKGTPGPRHYGRSSFGNRYRRHLKAIGIYQPNATILYAWKHTGISDAHELGGVKARTSQDQAGHASLDMHMRYLRRLGVDKAAEVDNMPDL